MSGTQIISNYELFTDINGKPLDAGYVWIGQPNMDPRVFPLPVYFDAALTIPATMPLRTSNGYIDHNGARTFVYIDGNYSIRVENKNTSLIYSVVDFLATGNRLDASLIGWARSDLISPIISTHQMLDAQPVNIWEFAYLITTKPMANDPSTWDWLPATQEFFNYLTTNHCIGKIPRGTYGHSGSINVKNTFGWGVIGDSITNTILRMDTDNQPILILGSIAGDAMYSYTLQNLQFLYKNTQPITNTNANSIVFAKDGFEGEFKNLRFSNGYYAIKVNAGVGGPWGQSWDNLVFGGGLVGGAMDWTGCVNAVPNNNWGRIFVDANSMVGPIFKQIKGYNWVWGNLEILSGTNAQWLDLQAGSELSLGAVKMEIANYSGAPGFNGSALINAPSSRLWIDQLQISGTVASMLFSSARYIINCSNGIFNIGSLNTQLTIAPTNFYVVNATAGDNQFKYTVSGSFPVAYSNIASAASAEFLTVFPDKNDRLSQNKGDVDYVISPGDPAIISFETALTATRVVSLPANNTCFNGLRYRIISDGAVNGANTVSIQAAGNIKATLSANKTFVDLEWRRGANPHTGWRVIGSGAIL